ncbi:MAG: glycosyltransferase family 2 protein [Campylobacteraceae bacterium]|jgi:glycosyltransferase involved in cell wall biosynthesis|nr:glycosyltransferase family 2 protein [Campylobacteraceae bacterium]
MKKIFALLCFKWYFHKHQYAKALSFLEKYTCTNDEILACYLLGMYETVANSTWDERDIRAGFAIAVSLSACGRFKEAEAIISRLTCRKGFDNYRIKLSIAIAFYMPLLALKLAKDNAPLDFHVSLLLKNREIDKAKELLRFITDKNDKKLDMSEAQLYLLTSNVIANSPSQQLDFLNRFFISYGLDTVTLKDTCKPLSVINLKSKTKRTVEGCLVSILVTVYNTADYIFSSIESLLAQTYKNIEIIVVDDCSTDDTPNIVRKIAMSESRVKYHRLSHNVGTFAAKTIGFQYALGDFVVCHDSDDWLHPQHVEIQMSPLLQDEELVATASYWVRIDNNGIYSAHSNYPLLRLNRTTLLFRKKRVLEEMGLWDIVRIGADSEFYVRMKLVFGQKAVRQIKMPLTIGAYRENSLMTSIDTGNGSKGISPIRLAYWEAWTRWHIDSFKKGEKPIMTNWTKTDPKRPFLAPKNIITPSDILKRYFL